jgi:hypothetical protein
MREIPTATCRWRLHTRRRRVSPRSNTDFVCVLQRSNCAPVRDPPMEPQARRARRMPRKCFLLPPAPSEVGLPSPREIRWTVIAVPAPHAEHARARALDWSPSQSTRPDYPESTKPPRLRGLRTGRRDSNPRPSGYEIARTTSPHACTRITMRPRCSQISPDPLNMEPRMAPRRSFASIESWCRQTPGNMPK